MKLPLLAALPMALIACSGNGPAPDETGNTPPVTVAPGGTPTPTPSASATPPATVVDGQPFGRTVIADFDAPWAMTFLPDRRMLVTEKDGRMLLVGADGQSRQTIARIAVDSAGQGGLMDVVLAPDSRKAAGSISAIRPQRTAASMSCWRAVACRRRTAPRS